MAPAPPKTRGSAARRRDAAAPRVAAGEGAALPVPLTGERDLGEPLCAPPPQLGLAACTLPVLINLAKPHVLRKQRAQAVCGDHLPRLGVAGGGSFPALDFGKGDVAAAGSTVRGGPRDTGAGVDVAEDASSGPS